MLSAQIINVITVDALTKRGSLQLCHSKLSHKEVKNICNHFVEKNSFSIISP